MDSSQNPLDIILRELRTDMLGTASHKKIGNGEIVFFFSKLFIDLKT